MKKSIADSNNLPILQKLEDSTQNGVLSKRLSFDHTAQAEKNACTVQDFIAKILEQCSEVKGQHAKKDARDFHNDAKFQQMDVEMRETEVRIDCNINLPVISLKKSAENGGVQVRRVVGK